jgi:hypothetical protein
MVAKAKGKAGDVRRRQGRCPLTGRQINEIDGDEEGVEVRIFICWGRRW